jgi:hypothetical protein
MNDHPEGSVYKGAVRMTRAGKCQGMQDRLTEIVLDAAGASEPSVPAERIML